MAPPLGVAMHTLPNITNVTVTVWHQNHTAAFNATLDQLVRHLATTHSRALSTGDTGKVTKPHQQHQEHIRPIKHDLWVGNKLNKNENWKRELNAESAAIVSMLNANKDDEDDDYTPINYVTVNTTVRAKIVPNKASNTTGVSAKSVTINALNITANPENNIPGNKIPATSRGMTNRETGFETFEKAINAFSEDTRHSIDDFADDLATYAVENRRLYAAHNEELLDFMSYTSVNIRRWCRAHVTNNTEIALCFEFGVRAYSKTMFGQPIEFVETPQRSRNYLEHLSHEHELNKTANGTTPTKPATNSTEFHIRPIRMSKSLGKRQLPAGPDWVPPPQPQGNIPEAILYVGEALSPNVRPEARDLSNIEGAEIILSQAKSNTTVASHTVVPVPAALSLTAPIELVPVSTGFSTVVARPRLLSSVYVPPRPLRPVPAPGDHYSKQITKFTALDNATSIPSNTSDLPTTTTTISSHKSTTTKSAAFGAKLGPVNNTNLDAGKHKPAHVTDELRAQNRVHREARRKLREEARARKSLMSSHRLDEHTNTQNSLERRSVITDGGGADPMLPWHDAPITTNFTQEWLDERDHDYSKDKFIGRWLGRLFIWKRPEYRRWRIREDAKKKAKLAKHVAEEEYKAAMEEAHRPANCELRSENAWKAYRKLGRLSSAKESWLFTDWTRKRAARRRIMEAKDRKPIKTNNDLEKAFVFYLEELALDRGVAGEWLKTCKNGEELLERLKTLPLADLKKDPVKPVDKRSITPVDPYLEASQATDKNGNVKHNAGEGMAKAAWHVLDEQNSEDSNNQHFKRGINDSSLSVISMAGDEETDADLEDGPIWLTVIQVLAGMSVVAVVVAVCAVRCSTQGRKKRAARANTVSRKRGCWAYLFRKKQREMPVVYSLETATEVSLVEEPALAYLGKAVQVDVREMV